MNLALPSQEDFKLLWSVFYTMQRMDYSYSVKNYEQREERCKAVILGRLEQLGTSGFSRVVQGCEIMIQNACKPESDIYEFNDKIVKAMKLLDSNPEKRIAELEAENARLTALLQQPMSEQDARYAILGAITKGFNAEDVPEKNHWLMEFWEIGQSLALIDRVANHLNLPNEHDNRAYDLQLWMDSPKPALRNLVDVVWSYVKESDEVPATYVADMLIAKAGMDSHEFANHPKSLGEIPVCYISGEQLEFLQRNNGCSVTKHSHSRLCKDSAYPLYLLAIDEHSLVNKLKPPIFAVDSEGGHCD